MSALATSDVDGWSLAAPFAAELGIGAVVTSQYYEVRLAAGSEQADYLVAFYRDRAPALRQVVKRLIAERPAYQGQGWRAIARLLDDWVGGDSLTTRRTPCIWFELDDHVNQPVGAVPSLSVCLAPAYRIDQVHEAGARVDAEHAAEILQLLGADAEAVERSNEAFERLPAGARWIHLSYMLGRPRRAAKLYGVMQRDQLLPYLTRIGWAGDIQAVAQALTTLYPAEVLGDELYVDLNLDDFADTQRCTLGLAVAQQHLLRGRDSDPARTALLNAWQGERLCDADKVAAVQQWPFSADPRRQHVFRRDLRYLDIKLVWRAGAGWQAKAYLGREVKRGLG